jgi:hypothetical protein
MLVSQALAASEDAACLTKSALKSYRTFAQGKSTTREWDLNRPDAKRQEMPARLADDDPRCGPASLQKFAGEDLTVRLPSLCQPLMPTACTACQHHEFEPAQ